MKKWVLICAVTWVAVAVATGLVHAADNSYDDLAVRGGVNIGADTGYPSDNTLAFQDGAGYIKFNGTDAYIYGHGSGGYSGLDIYADTGVRILQGVYADSELFITLGSVQLTSLNDDVMVNTYNSTYSDGSALTLKNDGSVLLRFY